MRPIQRALLLLAFVAASPAVSQKEPAPPPLIRTVEVTVTNVDVVVTDSKGRHVMDLTRDDFVIREDGVPQTITHFAVVDEGKTGALQGPEPAEPRTSDAVAAIPPPVRISVFIDNAHLSAGPRRSLLSAIAEFLQKSIGPRTEAMITTWDRNLLPRGTFTNDGTVLAGVVSRLQQEEPPSGTLSLAARDRLLRQLDEAVALPPSDRTRDTLIRSAIQSIRFYGMELSSELDSTLLALATAADQLSGIEGRKVLLYLSERVPENPGAELFQYARDALILSPRYAEVIPFDNEFSRRDRFKDVVAKANAAGVALYTFDARGLALPTDFSAERQSPASRINPALEQMNNETMMRLLAEETGGSSILDRNNFAAALSDLNGDLSSYYSLGYQSSAPRADRPRRVEVTLRRKGVTARARKSHIEKSAETRIADAVVSYLYYPRVTNPLHVRLDTGTPKKSGKSYLLPLMFHVPYDKLTLVPEGGRVRGRLLFAVAALDNTGRLAPVSTKYAPVEPPKGVLDSPAGQEFIFETDVKLRAVDQIVSVALADEPSKVVSYVQVPVSFKNKR